MKKKCFALLCAVLIAGALAGTALAGSPIKLLVNGKEIIPDVAPQIINERTMVPIRWVAEALNADVRWDENSKKVLINTAELNLLENQVKLLEKALAPKTPEEAVETWARGIKERNGALQYAVLSPRLKELKRSDYEGCYWVTGVSSPWVDDFEITKGVMDKDGLWNFEVDVKMMTSTGDAGTGTYQVAVKQYDNEQWYIESLGPEELEFADTEIDWQALAADYSPPSIEGFLKEAGKGHASDDGCIAITARLKQEFNRMGEDYRFFFMPHVSWYDFKSTGYEPVGEALSYLLFVWTGEFGSFPEKAPKYEAEARLRKIFAAPNNEYPRLEHKTYGKCVLFDGEAYSPWPESYNDSTMVYDLRELKMQQKDGHTYYTATADEYAFNMDMSYDPGENEGYLNQKAKTWGVDYDAALKRLLETGDISEAKSNGTFTLEFRVKDNETVPMFVSVDKTS